MSRTSRCFTRRGKAAYIALDIAAGLAVADAFRHRIEQIPARDYLRMSCYEKWLTAVTDLLLRSGLVTDAELESGRPSPGSIASYSAANRGDGAVLATHRRAG